MAGAVGERVRGDVEDPGQLGDLGGDGDREQEDRDRDHLHHDGVEDVGHGDQDDGSGSGPKTWLQVQPAQSTSSVRRSSSAARTSA